jgi:HK97 family phage prohead protease
MASNIDWTTLRSLETLKRLEQNERDDLALGLIERGLAVAPVVDPWKVTRVKDQDLLGQAVEWLKRNKRWEREEDRLRRSYGLFPYGPGPADRQLLDKALALIAVTEWESAEMRKAEKLAEAKLKAKPKPQTQKHPAGRIIRKTFHHRTLLHPRPGQSRDDFLSACIAEAVADGLDEDDATQECELEWSRRSATKAQRAAKDAPLWFTLSDESVDRCGDIVRQNWNVTEFERNPVCLWAHSSNLPPVGLWHDLRVENKSLVGRLELAPASASERIREISALVQCGVLRSCSVGFKPTKSSPRKSADGAIIGTIFEANTLIEVSLTPTPANSNALAIAKRLGVSKGTMDLVFKGGTRR